MDGKKRADIKSGFKGQGCSETSSTDRRIDRRYCKEDTNEISEPSPRDQGDA